MNTIDIIFGIILILGAVQGLRKGLFVELASLIGLIAGIYGAIHFSYYVGDWLVEKTSWSEQVIKLTAFAITFIIIVLAVSLAGKLLTKVASFAMLGIVNKVAGAIFSVIKFAFLLSVVLMFVDAADRQISIIGEDNKEGSILYPIVQPIAPAMLPSILKKAKDENIYNPDKEKESPDNDDSKI
ncbi:CvpA family protein [Dokdonia sp. Hel_I_53]|uniref:CvpA family protein n=1 Tax=Dokdonia sp. Hel_I_53 TaxID=1566287 RepID=UPI00119C2344|nr:CvpA family protein [Dokdonia sp. Hel_I_53]TVZ52798.1 membrane protein required for colicin V production [Dokdonia sp. Hel_I_53]